jgi:hypothetical protein
MAKPINTIFIGMVLVNVIVEGVDKFDTPLWDLCP